VIGEERALARPTWMLVVTGIAFAAAIGLTRFAIDRSISMERAKEQERTARAEKDRAKEALRAMAEQMRVLQVEIDGFDERVGALQKQLLAAQTAADRKRVTDEIATANTAKREVQRKLDAAAAAQAHSHRVKKLDFSHCQGTALGCLDEKDRSGKRR
jgi:hypothetical protein